MMWFYRVVLIFLMFLTVYDGFSKAYKYIGICEDDEIFNECPDQPEGVLNVHGLYNFSEFKYDLKGEDIFVSGNLTAVWNIQPNDRIQATVEIFVFDRGLWQPTVYSLNFRSLCPILYDKHQYWYKYWTQHVKNEKSVKDKCFLPGTKLVHNPFLIKFIAESPYSRMDGLYKWVVKFTAYDYLQISRPTSICFEIKLQSIRQ